MPSIQCPCGRLIQVREGQAGTRVRCTCGREVNVPSLRSLRVRKAWGEPIPAAAADESETRVSEDLSAAEQRQFLIFLTRPQDMPYRISFDAARHFVTACDRLLHQYFQQSKQRWGVDLQISIALLPNGDRLVDIQIQPPIVPPQVVSELAGQLRAMPGPPVVNGPVAFTLRKPIGSGAPRAPSFDVPFSSLIHHTGELDQLLMEAAGLDCQSAAAVPDRSKKSTWWSKFKTFCWPARCPAETREFRAKPSTSASQESPAHTTSELPQEVRAAVESGSIDQMEACLQRHPDATILYDCLANLRAERGEFQQAVSVFSQLIELDPENYSAYAVRARVHCMSGSMQQGLADYSKAIDGNPLDAQSRAARAMIYVELEAWEFAEADLTTAIQQAPLQPQLYVERARVRYAQQKTEDVLNDLQQALRLDPYHADACMLRGWTFQHRQPTTPADLAAAAEDYTRAIEIDRDNPACYVQRAEAYASQNKYALAIADCDRALVLDADNAVAFGIRGYANQQLDHLPQAVSDCTRAIDLGLESAAVYISRAVGYAAEGEIDLALADCDTAVRLAPDYAAAFNYRGMLRLSQGDVASATLDFAEASRLAPEWSTPREYRADTHRLQSEYEQAIDEYTRTIELEPGNLSAYVGRALAWMEKQELEKARQDFDEALRRDEECVPAYFHRAELHLRQEQFFQALEDLDKALAIDPDFAPGYHTRAQIYLHLQMNEQAQRDFSRVIELHPNWPGAYLGRANAWINLGDANRATADYREAAHLDPGSTEELTIHRLIVEAHHQHQQEHYEAAIAKTTEALELDNHCLPALATRAASYWYSEQFVEATEDYSLLLDLAPGAAFAYVGRGQVYVELGEYEMALEDLDQAVEMERQAGSQTGLAYALSGRALAYAGLQQFGAAQRDFGESLRLRPNNAWVHYNQGLMFRMLGEIAQAAEAFEHALAADDPPLTKRKRERAQAFLQRNS